MGVKTKDQNSRSNLHNRLTTWGERCGIESQSLASRFTMKIVVSIDWTSRDMRRLLLALLLAWTTAAHAQQEPPDYGIQNLRYQFTDVEVEILFDVVNTGGSADDDDAITAFLFTERGENLAQQPIPPLGAQQSETLTLSFAIDVFPAGSTQSLEVVLVGVEEVEAPIPESSGNNRGRIGVTLPSASGVMQPQVTTDAPGATNILGLSISLDNPITVAVAVGMVVAGIFLLVIVIAIVRMLFQRPPTFAAWQPPYATIPYLDPNTTAGRRQGWQIHAQNDLPPPPPSEGATHVRKRLVGADGASLGNWRISGIRLNQYDQYGRIARSQYLVSGGQTRRLSRLIKGAPNWNSDDLSQRVRPIVGAIVRRFVKGIAPRSATLPMALDIRLQGTRGTVNILFELFHVQGGQWHKIDQWQAEVAVADTTVEENLTYTFYGLRGGEDFKQFPQRLQSDMTRVLTDMMKHPDAQPTPGGTRPPQVP
jgi:hypothetical protein